MGKRISFFGIDPAVLLGTKILPGGDQPHAIFVNSLESWELHVTAPLVYTMIPSADVNALFIDWAPTGRKVGQFVEWSKQKYSALQLDLTSAVALPSMFECKASDGVEVLRKGTEGMMKGGRSICRDPSTIPKVLGSKIAAFWVPPDFDAKKVVALEWMMCSGAQSALRRLVGAMKNSRKFDQRYAVRIRDVQTMIPLRSWVDFQIEFRWQGDELVRPPDRDYFFD